MTKFLQFNNITFSELWGTKEDFISAFNETGLPQQYQGGNYVTNDDLSLIWLLLTGRFADSVVKPYNTFGGFIVRFMSKVWQYAPAWKKKLDIQNKLRSMDLNGSDIYEGSKAIYNSAINPNTQPGTNTDQELTYINNQNVTKHKKSKLEGLAILNDLLKNDVTEEFLRRFDDFFISIVYTGKELFYATYQGE